MDHALEQMTQIADELRFCTRPNEAVLETIRRMLHTHAQLSERIATWRSDPEFYNGMRCADEAQCLLNLL